jgi:hypothetical protein
MLPLVARNDAGVGRMPRLADFHAHWRVASVRGITSEAPKCEDTLPVGPRLGYIGLDDNYLTVRSGLSQTRSCLSDGMMRGSG